MEASLSCIESYAVSEYFVILGNLQAEALGKLFRTLYPGIRRTDGKSSPEDTQGVLICYIGVVLISLLITILMELVRCLLVLKLVRCD